MRRLGRTDDQEREEERDDHQACRQEEGRARQVPGTVRPEEFRERGGEEDRADHSRDAHDAAVGALQLALLAGADQARRDRLRGRPVEA